MTKHRLKRYIHVIMSIACTGQWFPAGQWKAACATPLLSLLMMQVRSCCAQAGAGGVFGVSMSHSHSCSCHGKHLHMRSYFNILTATESTAAVRTHEWKQGVCSKYSHGEHSQSTMADYKYRKAQSGSALSICSAHQKPPKWHLRMGARMYSPD